MLIQYIRAVYPHKRPYHGVEWATLTHSLGVSRRTSGSTDLRVGPRMSTLLIRADRMSTLLRVGPYEHLGSRSTG